MLKDVPCSYLVGLYNFTYDLPKNLERWLKNNIDDIEKAAGRGQEATLNSVFE